MITPELLTFIRTELAKGRTRDAIHADLINGGGWLPEDIEEAFREIVPITVTPTPVPAPAPIIAPVITPTPVVEPAPIITPPVIEPVITPAPIIEPAPVIAPVIAPMPEMPAHLPIEPVVHVQPQPQFVPPIIEPVMPQPAPAPAPAPIITPIITPTPMAAVTADPITVKKPRPYLLQGVFLAILSSIVFTVILFVDNSILAAFTFLSGGKGLLGFILVLAIIIEIIIAFFCGWILNIVTKWFNILDHSWAKAVFAMGCFSLIGTGYTAILAIIHPVVSLSLVLAILAIGLELFILTEIYHIGSLKALLVAIVSGVLMALVLGILAFLFSAIMASQQKSQTAPVPIMAPQGVITNTGS